MARRRAVWLAGMMGAGKSTVGPVLASRMGREFVDSDAEIARRAGCSIAELFAQRGEAAFRELEARELARLGDSDAVVALGGGALTREGALAALEAKGELVYLRARPETLLRRIGDARGRPLLAGLDARERLGRLRGLLEERGPAYERAAIVVDVDDAPVESVVDHVIAALETRRAGAEEGEA